MLTEITERSNIERACSRVIGNRGSSGIDGMQTDKLRDYLSNHYDSLIKSIIEGKYRPQSVLEVEIEKQDGGIRKLGIPTVLDRMIQQSISQWLEQFYEPEFSENSYGFRPSRNCKQAVQQAQTYLEEGRTWIVELDLEKFFDKVNHDRLMSLLSRKIDDKKTLQLIRKYLESGIMIDGVMSQRTEGTPQGSPLSPLLSNIILDELDKELERRGLNFIRYADDCSIYVKSKKSAERVKRSITKYIEGKLLLKVNENKSKISRPNSSTLLGFSFYKTQGSWKIRIHPKSIKRIKVKCKTITRRNNGLNIKQKIEKLKPVVKGWINYFKIANAKSIMQMLDERVRVNLRMSQWKEWKTCKTRIQSLLKLGINKMQAYEWGNSSKGYCRIAHSPILQRTLTNDYFAKLGLVSFSEYYKKCTQTQQLTLF